MKAWELTKKDLKLLLRDRRTFFVLLALPLIFITIIGMTTGRLIGFDEPNRVLKIAVADLINYDQIGFNEEGDSLPEQDAAGQRKVARNLFVKVVNRIQSHDGLQTAEAEATTDTTAYQNAVQLYREGDFNVALIVGPDFFRRVRRLEVEHIFDRKRGGIALSFDPQTFDPHKRSELEDHLPGLLGIDAKLLEVVSERIDLEEAVVTYKFPEDAVRMLLAAFRSQGHGEAVQELDRELIDNKKAQKISRELKSRGVLDVYPDGLAYGLLSLDLHVVSDTPSSATHSVIEQLVWADALAEVSLFPLCDNNYVRPRIRSKCARLEAERTAPLLALIKPQLPPKDVGRVYKEIIPGYTVLFVFFLVNIMARSFIQERALGTLRRLRIAPIRPTSVLLGKTVPFLLVSLIQTVLLFGFGRLIFMDLGSKPWLLLPVIFCTSLAATSLGLLVATIVRTESQVSAYANFVVIIMAGISGCFMPRDWLPELMQNISLGTPHAWALIGYKQILVPDVPNYGVLLQSCVFLCGFALLFFSAGTLRFSKID